MEMNHFSPNAPQNSFHQETGVDQLIPINMKQTVVHETHALYLWQINYLASKSSKVTSVPG